MRVAFLDFSGWDYTPDTPYQRPLGGSHSAMCYLAEELARQGHQVWIVNGVAEPVVVRGVSVVRFDAPGITAIAQADAVVVLNGCAYDKAAGLRRILGDGPMFVYWTQHAHDQPASKHLDDPAMRALWDEYVLISDWQARCYQETFGLPADKVSVLRNAIGPRFRHMFAGGKRVYGERSWPPVLAYTSTPFRGLSVLLDAFPRIRAAIPGTRLKVFSSMAVYQVSGERDPHADLYRRCRETEGVEYIGSVPQPELARELAGVTCLAYPNTFAETSCIAVMEALAAGCLVVTSNLGALPETLNGQGFSMTPSADPATYAEAFASLTVRVLQLVQNDPARAENYLSDQVELFNAAVTWPVRARQWGAWLAEKVSARWGIRSGQGSGAGAPLLAEQAPCPLPLSRTTTLIRGRHGIYACANTDATGRRLQSQGEPGEPTIRLLQSLVRPADTVVEVGAGIGTLTVPLTRQLGNGGQLTAVETDPDKFSLLCANVALNGLPQAQPRPALTAVDWDGLAERLPACRLLLVNDGREAQTLTDAVPLLDRHRPLIYCRIRSRAAFDAMTAITQRLEQRLFWHGYGDREAGETAVFILTLPVHTLMGIDAHPVTGFDEAARLFNGFTPAP